MKSVKITDSNPALRTLRHSWGTAVYTSEDGIGPMGSLHEAGDAIVAVVLLEDDETTVMGSGVMVGPGLVIVATHVLEEFNARNAMPVLLTFLPDGTRAWLPRESSTVSGPSAFGPDRRIVSDISLLSCTLNSDAHDAHVLTLAPLQLSLPLIGERLWAFGYRHEAIEDAAALITPLVSSGLVTSVFPQGRGERMPSVCVEVAMDTKGGMSGGPVVNANGDLVGIVSSSFDGGPSYVTLVWDVVRMKVSNVLPWLPFKGDIDLLSAQDFGLVKLKGHIKRSKRGKITVTLTSSEIKLLATTSTPGAVASLPPGTKPIIGEELEEFEDRWLREIESAAIDAAIEHLENSKLLGVCAALSASDVPAACSAPVFEFSVDDWEGLEDPDIQSAREDSEGIVRIEFAFDLLSVCWSVKVPTDDYFSLRDEYDRYFINIHVSGPTTSMELYQHCHFEATLMLNRKEAEFTQSSITFAGAVRRRRKRLNKFLASLEN